VTPMLAETILDQYWFQTVIKVAVVAAIVPTAALLLGIVFLFKVMSWMQSRLGPQEAGPRGLLQLVADGVKFLQKEDLMPDKADRFVFKAAPVVVLVSTFLVFVTIPASQHLVVEDLELGLFFLLAVSSLSVIGVLMAGWGSANKYALMGGLRAAGQLIAYELPLFLAVVAPVILAGSLNLNTIVAAQNEGAIFGWGGIGLPYIITPVGLIGFFLFLVAAQAELTQPPFDMPVAESELVSGYQVEYSGFRFLFFFMGEFATAFALAAVASLLFLGGWGLPWIPLDNDIYWIIGPFVLLAKIMLVSFLIFWFRFTYPRLREDQLQAFAWKYLVELALINILLTGVFVVVF
jgi:NADH-quinone oxidoreductase subunit H